MKYNYSVNCDLWHIRYNSSYRAFNYMASHDLSTPFEYVFTSARAIEMLCGDKLDEECKGFLQVIKGVKKMRNLIGVVYAGLLVFVTCCGAVDFHGRQGIGKSEDKGLSR